MIQRIKGEGEEYLLGLTPALGHSASGSVHLTYGWPDVYVASDSTPSLLFHNKRNGTFEEIGVYSGAAYNEDGREQAGMGAAAADYDHDGFLDILKTNFSNDLPTLYHNSRDGTFTDVTTPAGLSVHTQFVRWRCAFVDVDNDGWKGILIAAGHVYPEVDTLRGNETFLEQRQLYWNRRDGQFFDLSAKAGSGVLEKHSSRGLAATATPPAQFGVRPSTLTTLGWGWQGISQLFEAAPEWQSAATPSQQMEVDAWLGG